MLAPAVTAGKRVKGEKEYPHRHYHTPVQRSHLWRVVRGGGGSEAILLMYTEDIADISYVSV